MRAMIVAAGLGTRMQPLTRMRPKPAVPVCGVPLIVCALEWLRSHGVSEVVINTHHLPEVLEDIARHHRPDGMEVRFSRETELLDTGGGIRRVAGFLRESNPSLLIAGDMLADADLTALVDRHRERDDAITMLLRDDPRTQRFGSVGIDERGCVRRIASLIDLGGEVRAGLYPWVNVVSPRAFDALPDEETFSHFRGWIAPLLEAGATDIRGELDLPGVWEPVGTLPEYLASNLAPPELSYLDLEKAGRAAGTRFPKDVVIGAGATLGAGARLRRVVVWDGEDVPGTLRAEDGVFAGGAFHSVRPT